MKTNKDLERNLGEQPITKIIEENSLTPSILVKTSTEQVTFKMIKRACKGRRLNPNVKLKVANALNIACGKNYSVKELFNY